MTMKTKKTLQHIATVAVILLTLCLVFMMPAGAVGDIFHVSTAQDLKDAFSTGGEIILDASISVDEKLTIESMPVTLNLNGMTFTLAYYNSDAYAITVKNNFTIIGPGTVIINSPYGICSSRTFTGDVVINGGEFTGNDDNIYMFGIYGGKLTIENGQFTAPECVVNVFESDGGSAEIRGGSFLVEKSAELTYTIAPILGKDITISGGSFTANTFDNFALVSYGNTQISGGMFTGSIIGYPSTDVPIITGGTFSSDVTEYVAEGYKCISVGEDKWQVVEKTYTIEADKEEIAVNLNVGYDETEIVVTVTNTGNETITLDVGDAIYYSPGTSAGAGWTLDPAGSLDIIFMLNPGLLPGTYGETVTITPADEDGNQKTDNAITLQLTATINAVDGLYTIVYHENNGEYEQVKTYTIQPDSDGSISLTSIKELIFGNDDYFFVGWNKTSAVGEYFDYGDEWYFKEPTLLFGENNVVELFAIWAKAKVEGVIFGDSVQYDEETGVTTATFDAVNEDSIVDTNSSDAYLDSTSYPDNSTTITLSNDVQLTLIFADETTKGNYDIYPEILQAPILGAMVAYPWGNASLRGELAGSTNHFVAFTMSNLTNIPTISGEFNEDSANYIKASLGGKDAGLLATITADSAMVENNNITSVYVEFEFYPYDRLTDSAFFSAYHVKSSGDVEQLTRVQTEAELKLDEENKGAFLIEKRNPDTPNEYWLIRIVGDGFSSYAVGYVAPTSDNTGGSGDDNDDDENQNGDNTGGDNTGGDNSGDSPSYVGGGKKPTTVTPPTEEPTDEPTDVPEEPVPEIPVTPETPEEPSTPAPILAVLAGLGAAVVLRRK